MKKLLYELYTVASIAGPGLFQGSLIIEFCRLNLLNMISFAKKTPMGREFRPMGVESKNVGS
jgi:hypothetical protein